MPAHLRKLLAQLSDSFWLLPGLLALGGTLAAVALIEVDRSGVLPAWMLDGAFVYNGGGTGARTLLGAVASSAIGVAGTVFSITIAALSLAAGQMGPRLLRNFTRDRGVQCTLGAYLGTFCYALMVLRSVRTGDEGVFTPHLSLTVALALAFVCVGMLVFFVGHMAGRINVDTVVSLVSDDLRTAVDRLTTSVADEGPFAVDSLDLPVRVHDTRRGYLQHIDGGGLATWARDEDVVVRVLVRPGDYVFPGAPIALLSRAVDGAEAALADRIALGDARTSSEDLEFAVRQLVEVAVRALSPGINDPNTAISVLDRLGASLCDMASRFLPNGVHRCDGRVTLVVPYGDYASLVDAMFHMIRQNAAGSTAVLARMLEVLTAVAGCERDPGRARILARHAALVVDDAQRTIDNGADLDDVRQRHAAFRRMQETCPPA